MQKEHGDIVLGAVTILVDVSGDAPLSSTGTIERITGIELLGGRHSDPPITISGPVKVEGEIAEEEQFLIMDVTTAILPPEAYSRTT